MVFGEALFWKERGTCKYHIYKGYIEGTMAPEGEEQDAYFLGVGRSVYEFKGIIIAIIHRYDDVEENR